MSMFKHQAIAIQKHFSEIGSGTKYKIHFNRTYLNNRQGPVAKRHYQRHQAHAVA